MGYKPSEVGSYVICDAIKQNKSELKITKMQFSFALFSSLWDLYFEENPIKIELADPEL